VYLHFSAKYILVNIPKNVCFDNCIISSSTIITLSNIVLSQFLQVNPMFILTGCCEDGNVSVCSLFFSNET